MRSPSNFERLVLGCIKSYDSDQNTHFVALIFFRYLEDMQFFAPLRSQNFSKKSAKKFVISKFSNFSNYVNASIPKDHIANFLYTRRCEIAVVRRLFKMKPKMAQRRLKTVRRLFHPLLVAMCAMLKNVTTLIQFPPRQEVCDA